MLSWEKGALSLCPHALHLRGSVPSAPLIMYPGCTSPRHTPLKGLGRQTTPGPSAPHPFLRGPRHGGRSSPCLSHFCKWSGGLRAPACPLLLVPGGRRGTRVSTRRAAARARPGVGVVGWLGRRRLQRMRLTSLRRARCCPAAAIRAPLRLSAPTPALSRCLGRTAAGDGVRRVGGGG